MKDFPLNELLSAPDLDKIQEALLLIFGHINRKLKLSPYPIRRALPLVGAISRDFNDQLLRILTSHRLLYTPYETFERLLTQTMGIFRTWDDNIKECTNVAREVTRKRSEKFIPIKVAPAHAKLQDRTRYLRDWRKQHEQLAVMTGSTKGLGVGGVDMGGVDMEEEVKEAYEVMKRIDVLDVTLGACAFFDEFLRQWRPEVEETYGTEKVEQVLPTFPVQDGVLYRSADLSTLYIQHVVLKIHSGVDMQKLKRSWVALVSQHEILR